METSGGRTTSIIMPAMALPELRAAVAEIIQHAGR